MGIPMISSQYIDDCIEKDVLLHLDNYILRPLTPEELEESAKVVHKIKHKLGILGLNNGYKLAIKHEEGLKYGDVKLKEDFMGVLKTVEEFILKIA